MTTPEWLKPGISGAVIGAVMTAVVGFSWGGWMTSDGAGKMANAMARDRVTAAMVPVCLDMARNDPDRAAQLASIRDASRFRQRDAVMATGWATMPGSEAPDRDLAEACLAALQADAS
jgi:predicted TIM-barrel enzyme